MTDTLVMKRSNLILPTTGYELDREEMSYVGGGDITLFEMGRGLVSLVAAAIPGYGIGAATLKFLKGTSLWGILPATCAAVAVAFGIVGGKAVNALMNADSAGKGLRLTTTLGNILFSGIVGLLLGWLTWSIDTGLATFIIANSLGVNFVQF